MGGWFLWNVILSSTYNASSTIYYVRDSFLTGFGASLTWWLCLIIILLAIVVFELGVKALLAAFFPTDEDRFQVLEKDPSVKRRLEEAACEELQAGWGREGKGKGKGKRGEEESVREVVEGMRAEEEERRENEVKELLRGRVEGPARSGSELAGEVSAAEVDRTLSKGYGKVRRE